MRKLAFIIVTLLATGLICLQAEAVEQSKPKAPEVEVKVEREAYIYDVAGRRDPFLSLLIAAQAVRDKKKRAKGLIPIEDYDLSQVKLIAVMQEKKGNFALIGLPDGKFYTVSEGMTIGIHEGKIIRIVEDAIVIKEFKPDYKGKLQAEEKFIRLRAEEGE